MNAPMDEVLLAPPTAATQSPPTAGRFHHAALAAAMAKWRTLPQRDQRALLACSVALLSVLIWQVAWEPAATAIPRLKRELPLDQSQLGKVWKEGAEAARLNKLPSIARQAPDALRDSIATSLEAASVANADVKVSGGTLQIRIDKVSFNRWMQWQARARTEFGVMIVRMDAKRVGSEHGEVAISAELALPTP